MADQEGDTKPEDQVEATEELADTNKAEDSEAVEISDANPSDEQNQEEGQAPEKEKSSEEIVDENTTLPDDPPAEETKDAEVKEEENTQDADNKDSAEVEDGDAGDKGAEEADNVEESGEKKDADSENDKPEVEQAEEKGEDDKADKDAEPTEEDEPVKTTEEDEPIKTTEENDAADKDEKPTEENPVAVEDIANPAEESTVAPDVEENDAVPSSDPVQEEVVKTEPEEEVEEKEEPMPKVEEAPEAEIEQDQEPEEEPTADAQPESNEAKADRVSPDVKEEMEEEKPTSPVQVETDVSLLPPGSPKVAMEEKKHAVNLDATATVKFVLMPSGQVVTLACSLGQTLDSLRTHFAHELKMPSTVIMLMFDGKSISDSTILADLGVGPNGTIQLEMQSADPVNTPIKPYRPRQEYHMPDVITVRVMTEDCEAKDVVVEIERSRSKKPFLGGFRNKNSGAEYHNASAQTMKKPRPPPTVERYCRDTQTCEQKNMRQQTTNTTSTQMTGVGVHVSSTEDKLLVPGKYFTADDHLSMILRNVIILQKYYRRWLAKRYVTQLKEDKARRLEWERLEEMRKKREKEERIKRDYARRLNPKTKADFDMLLHCLEKWRQEEMERIDSTLTGAERKAALCMLLDQETELLSAIERHKNEAYEENKDKRVMQFLDKAAAPKQWQGHDGKLTYMDTPFTIRAKEMRDIFNSINMKYLTQDERLDVLLTLKHTVKEHDCKLTQEIIELIDREADLLMRGVKEGNLTGLRKRISTLFLQYIKTPTFNPEAARLLKVPQDPSTLRKNINYCHSCGSYLPSTEFFITSNSKNVGRCRNCVKIENDGRQREDHTFYRVMLKALRKLEEAMQDGSSICFLLQEHDLRYLVENIWSNQSVLSAWDDLYDLVLVRWDKHQEWSPWNCILLTHDEAEAHKKLFSLEEGYGQVFIHKVTQKHNFARNYFSRLPGMAELLRQKLGNRDLSTNNGPSVAGQPIPKAQKV